MEREECAAKVGAGETAKNREDLLATGDRLESSTGGELVATLKSYDAAVARIAQAQAEADALKNEVEKINEKFERIRRFRAKLTAMSDDEFESSQRSAEFIFGPLLKGKPGQQKEVARIDCAVKEVLKHYPNELMADQEEHISVMLCLFRSKKEVVECDGRKVTLDSTPFVESLKLLVAINKASPQVVKRFFDHRKFAALSMRYETMTPPTGELVATFYPGNLLADFIATNGADYRD